MSEQDAPQPVDEIDRLAQIVNENEPAPAEGEEKEPEFFEVEVGPEKLKVTKPLKEAWDGMQKTYTQTTQQVAEEKRAVAAEKAALAEQGKFLQTFAKEYAKLENVQTELQTYRNYTQAQWAQFNATDPENTAKHLEKFRALEDEAKNLETGLRGKAAEARTREETAAQLDLAKMNAELTSKIKDWSPAKLTELSSFATKTYGIPEEIVSSIRHAGIVQLAHEANLYRQIMARAAKASKPETNIVPINAPKTGGSNRASNELSDRDSPQEWLRKRNAQEAKLRGRS